MIKLLFGLVVVIIVVGVGRYLLTYLPCSLLLVTPANAAPTATVTRKQITNRSQFTQARTQANDSSACLRAAAAAIRGSNTSHATPTTATLEIELVASS